MMINAMILTLIGMSQVYMYCTHMLQPITLKSKGMIGLPYTSSI